jgi:ABC-2 type transport system ATP-binding protein
MSTEFPVSCRDVTKRYGSTVALNRLTLEVPLGQVLGLLGENGAGKTTLMRLILGLHWPDGGEIRLFGRSLLDDRERLLSRIGSLIEFPSFYPHLTGRENVEIVRRLRSLQRQETDRVLSLVGLGDASRRKAAGYSQGMKQRLAIAIALLGEPDLIILDEPTNGLDPNGIREIRELIRGLQNGGLLFEGTLDELNLREPARVRIATSEAARAFDVLTRDGNAVERVDDRLLVGCTVDRIPEINRILVEQGIPVQEITYQRFSLEQLYFNLPASERP